MNTLAKPNIHGQATVRSPVPYILNFELNIYAKNQDDALQVVEQILPYFNPEYVVTIKEVPSLDITRDIPIVLQSVGYSDDYEGDFSSRRVLMYTLDFSMKVYFYGVVNPDQGVIKDVTVNTRDYDNQQLMQSVRTVVTPLSAQKDGVYTIEETITDFDF